MVCARVLLKAGAADVVPADHLHRLKFYDVAPQTTHMQVELVEQVEVEDVSFIDCSLVLRLLLFIAKFQHVNLVLKFFV